MAPAEMRLVLDRQPLSGRRFGELAIAEGLIGEDVLAQALASQFGLPYRDLEQAGLLAKTVRLHPEYVITQPYGEGQLLTGALDLATVKALLGDRQFQAGLAAGEIPAWFELTPVAVAQR